MWLPTELDRRYIPKSWKKIIANTTTSINSLMKL